MQWNEIVFCQVDNILLTNFMFSEALTIATWSVIIQRKMCEISVYYSWGQTGCKTVDVSVIRYVGCCCFSTLDGRGQAMDKSELVCWQVFVCLGSVWPVFDDIKNVYTIVAVSLQLLHTNFGDHQTSHTKISLGKYETRHGARPCIHMQWGVFRVHSR